MAEAPHGTAPALEGKDIANPMAMILAAGAVLHYAAMAGHAGAGAGVAGDLRERARGDRVRRPHPRPRRPRVDDRVHRRRHLPHAHEDRRLVVARDEGVSAARAATRSATSTCASRRSPTPCPSTRRCSRRSASRAARRRRMARVRDDGRAARGGVLRASRRARTTAQRDPDRVLGGRPGRGRPRDRGGRREAGAKDLRGSAGDAVRAGVLRGLLHGSRGNRFEVYHRPPLYAAGRSDGAGHPRSAVRIPADRGAMRVPGGRCKTPCTAPPSVRPPP